jgi:hypothetical protein
MIRTENSQNTDLIVLLKNHPKSYQHSQPSYQHFFGSYQHFLASYQPPKKIKNLDKIALSLNLSKSYQHFWGSPIIIIYIYIYINTLIIEHFTFTS